MKHHIHPGSTGAVQLVERQAHSSEQLADTAKLQVTQVMLEGWIARAKKGKAEHARQKCKNRRRIGFWTGMISTRLNWTSKRASDRCCLVHADLGYHPTFCYQPG